MFVEALKVPGGVGCGDRSCSSPGEVSGEGSRPLVPLASFQIW